MVLQLNNISAREIAVLKWKCAAAKKIAELIKHAARITYILARVGRIID